MNLAEILDRLEAFYGPQEVTWPRDPFQFIVWWHCGYPASDAACARGWAAMREIGTEPADLLAADPKKVAAALKAGGMVPELRALRLKEIAQRAERGFVVTRAELKKYSNIADPGADRILLFSGKAAIAAVPSNCPHVAVRLMHGKERENYGVTYRQAQGLIERDVAETRDARERAFLLLKRHGQTFCKTKPKCGECPVKDVCRYVA
jgi:endonuclease-3